LAGRASASSPYARAEQLGTSEASTGGDFARWESVPLEQAPADESAAGGALDGVADSAVVQRAVEFPAAPAAGSTGTADQHSGSWAAADSEVVALDAYAATRHVEPSAAARRPATVMPPMPIVQRHTAATDPPAPVHRSSSAGISFASMFSAAAEAAETGYTTVQLQADDSSGSRKLDAAEPESVAVAQAAPTIQREGEAPPPSTPAPSGAPAGGAPAGTDLDEMARRLFEPLSARLRAEFWLDRERAGLMTDARP
jgi:hypothetical protein